MDAPDGLSQQKLMILSGTATQTHSCRCGHTRSLEKTLDQRVSRILPAEYESALLPGC